MSGPPDPVPLCPQHTPGRSLGPGQRPSNLRGRKWLGEFPEALPLPGASLGPLCPGPSHQAGASLQAQPLPHFAHHEAHWAGQLFLESYCAFAYFS